MLPSSWRHFALAPQLAGHFGVNKYGLIIPDN